MSFMLEGDSDWGLFQVWLGDRFDDWNLASQDNMWKVLEKEFWTPHVHNTLFASAQIWVQAFIKLSDTSEMVQAVNSSCTCNLPYSQHAIYQRSTFHQGGLFNLQDSYLSFCHICVTTAGAAHSALHAVCLFHPSPPSQPPPVDSGEEIHSSIQYHVENTCSKGVMGSEPERQTSVTFLSKM